MAGSPHKGHLPSNTWRMLTSREDSWSPRIFLCGKVIPLCSYASVGGLTHEKWREKLFHFLGESLFNLTVNFQINHLEHHI